MAGVEVTWLVVLPAILGCCVVLTDMAIKAMERAVRPRVCLHRFYMGERCGECGTPR